MGLRRSQRISGLALAGCAAAALTLAGCGGGAAGSPVPAPTPTSVGGSLYPAAFLTLEPTYATVMLWTLDYHLLAVFRDVSWADPGPGTAVVGSSLPDPPKALPFAFLETGTRTASLVRVADGESLGVLTLQTPTGLAGSIPGGFALAGDYAQGTALLYLLDLRAAEAAAAPERVWRQAGPAAIPIAVRLDRARPVEVLFSTAADLNFARRGSLQPFGLNSLWLETGETSTRVAPEIAFLGISPDLAWYAVSDPGTSPPQLEIRRYDGSASIVFPPTSGSRALGRAVFSPEGRFVAWPVSLPTEADGSRTLINIAATSGGVPLSLTPEQLSSNGQPPIERAVPVAWLDEQTLLLQVDLEGQPQVVRIRSDGSGMQMAGQGVFLSLVYR